MKYIEINGRQFSKGHAMIVAELSANHLHKYELAEKTIRAIAASGADAVKLQTYTADTITIDCDNEYFQIRRGTLWDGKTLYQLYNEAYTPWEWFPKLKKIADDEGLIFFSSPFDNSAVDFLYDLNVPLYKIASFEITDIPLIEYIASKKKPVIIATGIASLSDIEEAVSACRRVGNNDIILLKCTSEYPAKIEDAHVCMIPHLAETFGVMSGLSDHTIGSSVAAAAVAFGASMIEKHFITDRSLGGPDAPFSMEPHEYKVMIQTIREIEKSIGSIDYTLPDHIQRSREFSRSLFIISDVKQGDIVTKENIRSIRPGFGLHPRFYPDILGKKFRCSVKRGTPLTWNLLEMED